MIAAGNLAFSTQYLLSNTSHRHLKCEPTFCLRSLSSFSRCILSRLCFSKNSSCLISYFLLWSCTFFAYTFPKKTTRQRSSDHKAWSCSNTSPKQCHSLHTRGMISFITLSASSSKSILQHWPKSRTASSQSPSSLHCTQHHVFLRFNVSCTVNCIVASPHTQQSARYLWAMPRHL